MIMYIFLGICAFMALYPMVFAIMTSIKTPEEYVTNKLRFPDQITFGNYVYAWKNGNMLRYFLNTLLVIPAGLIVYLFICVSAGFAFGRLRFKGRLPRSPLPDDFSPDAAFHTDFPDMPASQTREQLLRPYPRLGRLFHAVRYLHHDNILLDRTDVTRGIRQA